MLSRLTGTGTHRGDFMGIAPTGSPVTVSILNLMRLQGGMVVEEWERFDTASLLQQIGALPAPAEAAG